MAKRPKIQAYPMDDGEWLVRGTQDPHVALAAVVDMMGEEVSTEELLHGVSLEKQHWCAICPDGVLPSAVEAMGDWCHGLLQLARPGFYRMNPVGPNSWEREDAGWSWQLGYATRSGYGAFSGVYFRSW